MIAVLVRNSPGGRRGRDVIEPLAVTEQAAVARGRQELAREASDRMLVSLTAASGWTGPGGIVSIVEPEAGERRGMVRACTLTISRGDDTITMDTAMTVEVEA